MDYLGTIQSKLSDKGWQVLVPEKGLVAAIDVTSIATINYAIGDPVIIGELRDYGGTLYLIKGVMPQDYDDPDAVANDDGDQTFAYFKGLNRNNKVTEQLPPVEGDVMIGYDNDKDNPFLFLMGGGGVALQASPRAYQLMTAIGEYLVEARTYKFLTSGFKYESRRALPELPYHQYHSVYRDTYDTLDPSPIAMKNLIGYIANAPSVRKDSTSRTTGLWTQIGNYIIEVDKQTNKLSVDYVLNKAAPTATGSRYGIEISPTGLKVSWGLEEKRVIELNTLETKLVHNASSLTLTDTGIVLDAPRIDIKTSNTSFMSMNPTATILSGTATKIASPIEFSEIATYNPTGLDAVIPNLIYTKALGLNVSKIALRVDGIALINRVFFDLAWNNLIDQLATHTHSALGFGVPTSPPITPFSILRIPGAVVLSESLVTTTLV